MMTTMMVFLLLPGLAVAAAQPRVQLQNVDNEVLASISFAEQGGMALNATRCVDRSNFCGRFARNDCSSDAELLPSKIAFSTPDGNTTRHIRVTADGVLKFIGPGCVQLNAEWDAEPASGLRLVEDGRASGFIGTSERGFELLSGHGFAVNGGGVEPVCVCHHGTPATKNCMVHTASSCSSCHSGYFLNGSACIPWKACIEGFGMSKEGTATADRECEACLAGVSFSDQVDGSACKAVRSPCPRGHYTELAASANRDTVCAANPEGTFTSSAGQATYAKWRTCPAGFGMSKEGTATADRECEACPTGVSFSTTNDGSACEAVNACGAGEYETLAPAAATDRTCASHTECASHEYESKAPGATTDRECQQKVCHCAHGTHAMGDACPEHDEPKCVSCASHFHLADDDRQCNADACICKHGIAATGNACTAHAATQCTSCNAGFHLVGQATAAGQDCAANVCTCADGKAATGTACTTDGAAICMSCGAGFKLSAFKTCELEVCVPNPCQNGGRCVAGTNEAPLSYRCKCEPGFFGSECEHIDQSGCKRAAEAQFGVAPGRKARLKYINNDKMPPGCSVKAYKDALGPKSWEPLKWDFTPEQVPPDEPDPEWALKQCGGGFKGWDNFHFCQHFGYGAADLKGTVHEGSSPLGEATWNIAGANNNMYTPGVADGTIRAHGGFAIKGGVEFEPEVAYSGTWYPICGHWAWDDNWAATAACKQAGFHGGTMRRTGKKLWTYSMRVGRCSASDSGVTDCKRGGNSYGNLDVPECRAGQDGGIAIMCHGQSIRTPPRGVGIRTPSWLPGRRRLLEEWGVVRRAWNNVQNFVEKLIGKEDHPPHTAWYQVSPVVTHSTVRAEGGVVVDANVPFYPEVAGGGKWNPVCGRDFSDNDNGATTICRALGFGSGEAIASARRLPAEAARVGQCQPGESLNRCLGGNNFWVADRAPESLNLSWDSNGDHVLSGERTLLGDLTPISTKVGYKDYMVNRGIKGEGLQIGGKYYRLGVFAHAPAELKYDLASKYSTFTACAGLDSRAQCGDGLDFLVKVSGKNVQRTYNAFTRSKGQAAKCFSIDVQGVDTLVLIANKRGNNHCDHATWADATLYKSYCMTGDARSVQVVCRPKKHCVFLHGMDNKPQTEAKTFRTVADEGSWFACPSGTVARFGKGVKPTKSLLQALQPSFVLSPSSNYLHKETEQNKEFYNKHGRWTKKKDIGTGAVLCDRETFGADPWPGKKKECQCEEPAGHLDWRIWEKPYLATSPGEKIYFQDWTTDSGVFKFGQTGGKDLKDERKYGNKIGDYGRYWGALHKHTPQCKTHTFINENTELDGWDSPRLQQAFCNAATSKGQPRDTSMKDIADWTECATEEGHCACKGGEWRFGRGANWVYQKKSNKDFERCGSSSFGGRDPAPGKTKHCQCRGGKMPSDYTPKSAAARIEDTIVFTHSMGNLILAAALKNNMCKFGSGGSWYSVAGPMAGNKAPGLMRPCCASTSSRFKMAMAGMPIDRFCDGNRLSSAPITLADDYTSWDGQNFRWANSLRNLMRDEPALKGAACGVDATGLGVAGAYTSYRLSAVWTRNISPCSKVSMGKLVTVYSSRPKFSIENDGIVSLDSCQAALPDAMKAAPFEAYNGRRGSTKDAPTLWKTNQNHADLTCRSGNWMQACSWYGLAV